MISRRAQRVDSSGIRKVFELAAKIKEPLNLSIGQPDFDVPDTVKQAAIDCIKRGFNKYTLTQGIPELRQLVLERVSRSRNRHYTPDQILITSGVSGGLLLALICLIEPGDEIVFFDPYFVMYKHLVNLLDGKPVIVDTYPDFRIDGEKLKKAITKRTKAIIVNSPANPTGYVYSEDDIKTVVDIAVKNNLLIISDEIYDGFVYNGEFFSPASIYENTLVLGGFSKTYAMTGWRVGYGIGDPTLIAEMIKIQQYSFVCAPSPFQYAAVEALECDMSDFREAYRRKRDIVYEGLCQRFDVIKPGGAFYIFPRLKQGDVDSFVEKAIQNRVLIIPGKVFSERNTHFRISFAASDDVLRKGVEILNRIAEENNK